MEPRQIAVVAVAVLLLAGGGVVGFELFAPESATRVNDASIDGSNGSTGAPANGSTATEGSGGGAGGETVLATGEFEGKDGHDVNGTVELVRSDGELYLRFVDYQQTQGPDVYIYVTPAEDPDSQSEIRDGTKVRIDGGADGGESTKEGTFVQKLPEGVEAESVNGVAAWCDRFGVPFGAATLSR